MYRQVFQLVHSRTNTVFLSACKNGLGSLFVCDDANHRVLLAQHQQVAGITSKLFRDRTVKKAAPWPYENKKYTLLHAYFDSTLKRFDDNTKLIIVEGNIASGKSALAKTLAEELEMKFLPEVSLDDIYILSDSGFDIRSVDHLMPESQRTCDISTFYRDPHNRNVAKMQFHMYRLRIQQYADAMAHLFNTGTGMILERSPFTDFVFVEAMLKAGYISKGAYNHYYDCRNNSIIELLRPHLVIYLDVPSDILLERIKKRNLPHEVNSKVLTKEYLDSIEYFYKQRYLKEISEHSELLIYDWSSYGDAEVVVEDIERIDFDRYDRYDLKLRDWRDDDFWHWNNMRRYFTNHKDELLMSTFGTCWDVPELLSSGQDWKDYFEVIETYVPGFKFAKGYNKDLGDKYLFRMKSDYRELQKYTIYYNK